MANPQELQALFSGVLTPLQLQAQRQQQQAQMMQAYGQDSDRPWRLTLAQSLQQLGAALPNSPERQQQAQAQANQQTLGRATKEFASLLKEGMTPDEAQGKVLQSALKEFADQGNWEAVQALAPQYAALEARNLERAKLKQEALNLEQQRRTSASQEKENLAKVGDMEADNTREDSKLALDKSKAATERQKALSEMRDRGAVPVKFKGDPGVYEAQRDEQGRLFIPTENGPQYLKQGEYSLVDKSAGNPDKLQSLDSTAVKELTSVGANYSAVKNMKTKFKPQFAGYGVREAANISLALSKNIFGDNLDAIEFWQDYQEKTNRIRNELFGSALTENEKIEYEKATINPGMRPEVIVRYLARQEAAAKKAARILGEGYYELTGKKGPIEKFIGTSLDDLGQTETADPTKMKPGESMTLPGGARLKIN